MDLNERKPTYCFFIDKVNAKFPGFSKLINAINSVFGKTELISSLEGVNEPKEVIPLGIVASHLFLKKFPKGEISFMVDATSLGLLRISRFYIQRKDFFNPNLLGSVLRYVKYYFLEKKVINNFSKVIVVSEHDANYLRRTFHCSNIEVVSNGADLANLSYKKEKDFTYTLGILSYWGANSLDDIEWFVKDYFPRLKIIFPEIKLITAGRGAKEESLLFFQENGIEYLGEVDDLWDFFNRIDIYITTLRKECGILNKVLDAMAHQKIVVGLEHNMYAFNELKNGFFTYKNFDELVAAIETIKKDQKLAGLKIKNAYDYILKHHNWTNNYRQLKLLIDGSFKNRQFLDK